MNLSRFIIESIQKSGVDTVFGLPGVHALGLWKAVESTGIGYVGFRHEQAAAHAADGYGRATMRPGVVLLSTGPGALNALSALGEAMVSSSPVLAITSAIPSKYVGKGKGFLHEGKDLQPAFESVSRFAARATRPSEVPELLATALRATMMGRPGPAVLEIPADFLDEDLDAEPVGPMIDKPVAGAAEVEEASMLIAIAARPLIVAGSGVIRSDATAALIELAEAIDAPVITTFMGKGAMPENHRLAVGAMMRQPEAADLFRQSDLVISIGVRYSGMVTGNWKLELPSQHIQIDIDPAQIGINYPVRLGIVSDARLALEQLARSPSDNKIPPSRNSYVEFARELRSTAFERAEREGADEMRWLAAIRSALPPEVVTTHDMTVPSYWSAPFLEITRPRTFHYPYGYGSLGFSFPAALGVAASNPSKAVVSFSGDGGFQYHSRELATAAEYRLPVIALVWNDRSWGVLRAFSRARYGSEFGLDLPGPDFVLMAESYGVEASSISDPDDLAKVLTDAVENPRPLLIELPGTWKLPPPSEYYGR